MKKLERSQTKAIGSSDASKSTPSLSELRAIRLAQRATNQRVEELKLKLFRMTEQHMDQAVSVIRDWMHKK